MRWALGKLLSYVCISMPCLGATLHVSPLVVDPRSKINTKERSDSAIFLIVCPATVLFHWLKELHRWAPSLRAVVIHSISKTGSELASLGEAGVEMALRRLQRSNITRGLVAITTYDGLRKYQKSLSLVEWTAVCLDEGQKIRNPTAKITSICKELPAFHRLILSGTPIQNNLTELWSLLDFCYPGRLGTLPAFEQEFASPIRAGGYAGAGRLKIDIAVRIATTLQRIVRPILLRRRKSDLSVATALPKKTEQVLFCKLATRQQDIYREILNSPEVEAVLQRKALAFRAITTLRKLCNHPAFVYRTMVKSCGLMKSDETGEGEGEGGQQKAKTKKNKDKNSPHAVDIEQNDNDEDDNPPEDDDDEVEREPFCPRRASVARQRQTPRVIQGASSLEDRGP